MKKTGKGSKATNDWITTNRNCVINEGYIVDCVSFSLFNDVYGWDKSVLGKVTKLIYSAAHKLAVPGFIIAGLPNSYNIYIELRTGVECCSFGHNACPNLEQSKYFRQYLAVTSLCFILRWDLLQDIETYTLDVMKCFLDNLHTIIKLVVYWRRFLVCRITTGVS